jgi:predicted DNA-binding transcriptional regulator YafY
MTKKGKEILTFALDRIQNIISLGSELFLEHKTFNPHTYFNDIVGVTRNTADTPTHIEFLANYAQAPYIKTKPIHSSQKIVEERKEGTIFCIDVVPNFELERELIGFGEGLKVISPTSFMRRIRRKVRLMNEIYFPSELPE